MSNYANLKNAIQSVIKTNGNNEITGQLLQNELLAMITTLGYGYQFMGVASPDTVPGTPDAKVFYIAYTPGTYTNFGGITVTGLCVLKYATGWTKEDIPISGGGGGTDFTVETTDLTLQSGTPAKLKFADRLRESNITTGKNYIILRETGTFAQQVQTANCIYEIRYDFDLNNGSVQIPDNCVLHFVGGRILNGTIVGNNTIISANIEQIFDNVNISGDFETEFLAEWFLPVYDANRDYSTLLTNILNCGANEIIFCVPNVYKITSTIVINNDVTIKGLGRFLGFLSQNQELATISAVGNITAIEYHHTDFQRKIELCGLIVVSGNEDVEDYTTPIVYIQQDAGGWQGANIELYIRSRHKSVSYSGKTYTYRGMVGIEINTLSGSLTLSDIKGAIVCYKGLYLHGQYFITDLNLSGRIEACYGGEIQGSFIYLRGKFQTLSFPNDRPAIRPSESFFYGGAKFCQESTVWDLDTKDGVLSSVRCACNNALSALQNVVVDGDNAPNFPTIQTASFINSNFGMFNNVSDLLDLTIECSQDDFATILFTKDDFMGLQSLFQNFKHLSGYTNTKIDELANMTPFIKTSILQASAVDTTKPLQIRVKFRYSESAEHWLRLYTWSYLQATVKRKVYTDNAFTNLIATDEFDTTPFSDGNSKTQRASFAYFRYYGDTIYNEVELNYQQNVYGTLFGNPTYHLIGFNLFSFQTEANKKVSLLTNRIYHDWQISTIGTRRLIVPLQLKTCNQGFVIVAPTTLATQMIIAFTALPSDGLADYSSKITRGGFLILNTNGTAKVSGISAAANVYKSDHPMIGLSYYRLSLTNCFCRVEYIFGRGVQLEDFVASGASSIGQNQTTLTIERNYVVSTNSNRPSLSANDAGYQYFDTTLKKPIWWDGTQWVDATGTAIS